jgi:hypothetical protein
MAGEQEHENHKGGMRWFRFVALASLLALSALAVALLTPANFSGRSAADRGSSTVNGTLDEQRYSPLTQISALDRLGRERRDRPRSRLRDASVACNSLLLRAELLRVQRDRLRDR